MGIVSFSGAAKDHIPHKNLAYQALFYCLTDFRACYADLPEGGLKKLVWGSPCFMGREHNSSPAAS